VRAGAFLFLAVKGGGGPRWARYSKPVPLTFDPVQSGERPFPLTQENPMHQSEPVYDFTNVRLLRNGLHLDVPFEEYLRWPIMSQSTLKEGRRSMAHLKANMDGERKMVPTDNMLIGSALHCCFLEPDQAEKRVITWTGGARRGKEWLAFKEEHASKIILTENMGDKLAGMLASLRKHPEVKRWLSKIESVETSAIGDVHGLRMKGRCDALTPDPLIDLKKVSDGDPHKFTRTIGTYGYHVQAAIYTQLFQRDRFMLITVEDDAPYSVCPYELSPAWIRQGDKEASELIEKVIWCQEHGDWPGRSDVPVTLELPEWMAESQVTFGD
jgi:exodeoxyribonuclease VIII